MKRTLKDYFAPGAAKRSQGQESITGAATPNDDQIITATGTVQEAGPSSTPTVYPVTKLSTAFPSNSTTYDLGLIDIQVLSNNEKLHLLMTPWTAPEGFTWPYSVRKDGDKTRRKYLGQQHLSGNFDVFSYSITKNGLFCCPCVIFAPEEAGGVKLNRLVKVPLQQFSHLTGRDGYLVSHLATKFHEDSMAKSAAFRAMMSSGQGDVSSQMKTAVAVQIEKNRAALGRIILSIEFLGRLGVPLRGHQDAGPINIPTAASRDIDYGQGNLRATLQLMSECNDNVVRQHLMSAGKNATYISPQAQNELISCINKVFQRTIIDQVNHSGFFSLLADETTDVSRREQLTVCLRYHVNGDGIYERFLCFAEAPDLTGFGLAQQLQAILRDCGIDISRMVGQGYDGAAAMSGIKNGVQKFMRDKCPAAIYVHCASHSLNLCLLKAGEVQEIRKAVTLMHEIAVFFNESNKRLLDLESSIQETCPESTHAGLKYHCTTRWVERQEAVQIFRELLPAVRHSLEKLRLWRKTECAGKAALLQSALEEGGFLVAQQILIGVLEVTKPLSVKLQAVNQDMHYAMESVKDCEQVLQQMRSDEDIFERMFSRAEQANGEEIMMPRTANKQRNRANPPADSPRQYYKRAVFLPYLDVCLGQIRERFQSHNKLAYMMCQLLPAYCVDTDLSVLAEASDIYKEFLPGGVESVETELMRWKAYWGRQSSEARPDRVLDALAVTRMLGTYPVIEVLLRIFATLPVTTASGERSFSALKLLKSYLRSTMREERVNGLAQMYINKDIALKSDDVIDEFARHNRRLSFI